MTSINQQLFLMVLFVPLTFSQIKFPLEETEHLTFSTVIYIGEKNIPEKVEISFSERGIQLFEKAKYHPKDSASSEYFGIAEDGDEIYKENVKFYGLPTFESYIIKMSEKPHRDTNAILGLAPEKENSLKTFFFVDYISNLHGLNKIFYLNSKEKFLSFGEYPEDYYQMYKGREKQLKFCRLDESFPDEYRCKVDSVYFKGKEDFFNFLPIEESVIFCPRANAIYAPFKFIEFIIKNYFKEQFEEKSCLPIGNEFFVFVVCNEDYNYEEDKRLTDFTFVINEYSIKIKTKNLFTKYGDKIYFLIVYNHSKPDWYFGYPFFKQYQIVFDLENKLVSFVPYKNSEESNDSA